MPGTLCNIVKILAFVNSSCNCGSRNSRMRVYKACKRDSPHDVFPTLQMHTRTHLFSFWYQVLLLEAGKMSNRNKDVETHTFKRSLPSRIGFSNAEIDWMACLYDVILWLLRSCLTSSSLWPADNVADRWNMTRGRNITFYQKVYNGLVMLTFRLWVKAKSSGCSCYERIVPSFWVPSEHPPAIHQRFDSGRHVWRVTCRKCDASRFIAEGFFLNPFIHSTYFPDKLDKGRN